LTGEKLTERYLKLARDYCKHDKGVTQIDELIGTEWAFIPHFWPLLCLPVRDQHAHRHCAGRRHSRRRAKGSTAARDRYLNLLAAGGSKYPIDLLKAAGVDPTTSAPFDAAMKEMNRTMDEMEKILARQEKAKKK
jgi:oligoendopeptidase F